MVTPEEAQEEAKIKAEEEVKRKAEEEAKRKAEEEEALLATERPTPTPTQALPEENGNPETTSPTPITPKPAKPAQPAQTAQSPQPDKLSVQQPSSTNQSTATATTESPSTAKTYKSFSQTPPPGSSKEPPGFFTKLFNVGDDGIMEMIKELVQAKWLKERCKDNKILFAALLPLNTVVAGLASAVLIGVGAVTAGILKGAYDVFDGLSSIIAELIVCVSGTPATSPLKPPHSTEIIKAGKTFGKGLAKFIIGSAIVAGIAMGGAGIAGVGAAAMLPVLTTIGKVISIGMLSLSSSAGLGLLTWVTIEQQSRVKLYH